MRSTYEEVIAANIQHNSGAEVEGSTKRFSGQRARLCSIAALVALSLSVSLESKAQVVYEIVDSAGHVTHSTHPPATSGKFKVTKINTQTGEALPYTPKDTQSPATTTNTTTSPTTTTTTPTTTTTTPTTTTTTPNDDYYYYYDTNDNYYDTTDNNYYGTNEPNCVLRGVGLARYER